MKTEHAVRVRVSGKWHLPFWPSKSLQTHNYKTIYTFISTPSQQRQVTTTGNRIRHPRVVGQRTGDNCELARRHNRMIPAHRASALRLAPPFASASASAFAAAAASARRGASQLAAATAAAAAATATATATDVSTAAAAAAAAAIVADAAGRVDAQQQPAALRHRDRAQIGRAQQLRRPP